ncbi:MAG TPA: hypothetical protein VFZ00_02150 [Solirubrobacter sp.]|jgi:hypothetical protein|nr:hypothetical protein [Solirubrobacter sp.]
MRAILPLALVIAALTGSTAHAATAIPDLGSPSPTVAPAPSTQGIIMKDGNICSPRLGCW